MGEQTPKKSTTMESLARQEERILAILREERKRTKERFPLLYAFLATFGLACVFAGLNRVINDVDFLDNNPVALIGMGLFILLVTGAAYKKLG